MRKTRYKPCENNDNQDCLAMKLSDKALRRIGRSLLQSMDENTDQDEPRDTPNSVRGEPTTTACAAAAVNPPRSAGNRKATVLPFRARGPHG
jgi:hypothetical protein